MPINPPIGLTHSTTTELFQNVSLRFFQALASEPKGWSAEISEDIGSGPVLREKYPVDITNLGAGFRDWTDDRQAIDTEFHAYTVNNRNFERTIEIPINEVRAAMASGNAGLLAPYLNQVPKLVRQAGKHKDIQTAALLQNTTTLFSYESPTQLFWSESHPVDPRDPASAAVWSNLHTSLPLTLDNYEVLRRRVAGIKDPSNKSSLGLRLVGVLVPTALESDAMKIFNRAFVLENSLTNDAAAGVTNIFAGESRVVVAPELDNEPTTWYGLATNTEMMPVVQQWAFGGEPEIYFLGEGSEHAIKRNRICIAASMFGAVGPGMPFAIHRCTA